MDRLAELIANVDDVTIKHHVIVTRKSWVKICVKIVELVAYIEQVEASACEYCHDEALRPARERLEKALEGNNG